MKEKVASFGELMLRLSTPGYTRFGQTDTLNASFGGGEANVAVSLANFGVPVKFLSRLPSNDLAQAAVRELRAFGVETGEIIYGGERMGIYFLETGAVNRPSKVIYDRSGSAISEIKPGMIDWKKAFSDVSWFHWTGITPAISASAAEVCREAIATANEMGIMVSTDLNYRKNLWKYGKKAFEVMPDLVQGSDLILGNEEDAAEALHIHPGGVEVNSGILDTEAYRSVSTEIMQQFPRCKYVITSLRSSLNANHNRWSGVLYDGKKFYTGSEYDITHIVDRVGGGDSFMGGLIYGLLTFKDDPQQALDFAIAASCLKHTINGDYNRVTVEEVLRLMSGDRSGRVSR